MLNGALFFLRFQVEIDEFYFYKISSWYWWVLFLYDFKLMLSFIFIRFRVDSYEFYFYKILSWRRCERCCRSKANLSG